MNMKKTISRIFLLLVILAMQSHFVQAQAYSFTYQGSLKTGGTAVTGTYDFQFDICDAPTGGNVLATIARSGVSVANGIFTVNLDASETVFSGAERYLQIRVKLAGGSVWDSLSPRQPITSAPYAIQSINSVNAQFANGANSATFAVTATNASFAEQAQFALNASNAVNATTATTALNVTGIVSVTNGGTGSTNAAGARMNLGLGALSTVTPTGAANNKTFLRGDNTWNEPPLTFNVMLALEQGFSSGTKYYYPSGTPTGKFGTDVQFSAFLLPRACTLGDFKLTVPVTFGFKNFQILYSTDPSLINNGTVAINLTAQNDSNAPFSVSLPDTVNIPAGNYITIVDRFTFNGNGSMNIPFSISFTCR